MTAYLLAAGVPRAGVPLGGGGGRHSRHPTLLLLKLVNTLELLRVPHPRLTAVPEMLTIVNPLIVKIINKTKGPHL